MANGIKSAPEIFQKTNVNIFCDIDGVEVVFDDIIISAESEKDHDDIFRKVMQRAKDNNIKFNMA